MGDKRFRLTDAPLIHVLASIRVNPVADLPGRLLAIGDAMKALGYLDRLENKLEKFTVRLSAPWIKDQGDSPPVDLRVETSWVFVHENKGRTVTISSDQIAFQASTYTKFELFSRELLEVIAALVHALSPEPQVTKRVGLRYVNLIELAEKDPSFWMERSILGTDLAGTSAVRQFTRIERQLVMPTGKLSIRYSDLPGQPPLPPGIDPVGLRVPKPVLGLNAQSRFALLDIDRFFARPTAFSIEELRSTFTMFNEDCEQAFRATTTKEAKKEWKEET